MIFIQKLRHNYLLWLGVILWGGLLGNGVVALPYGVGQYGTCQYSSCSISLTGSGNINLQITPKNSGSVNTTYSSAVTVSTNSSNGYTLSFRDSNTNTNIVSGLNSILATTATPASPTILATNRWGYRVDDLAGFGAGPTAAQTNAISSIYTFAAVPASSQPEHVLRTTMSAANSPQTTLVWYGVRATIIKPKGTYTNQVVYTVVTNN